MNLASLPVILRAFGCALLLCFGCATRVAAGPPQISGSDDSSSWLATISPSNWKFPELRLPTMSKRSTAKTNKPAPMSGMTRQVGQTWKKTTQTLNPMNWLPKSDKPKASSKTRSRDQEEGGWTSWFKAKEEPKKIETVNDFLRQPSPF